MFVYLAHTNYKVEKTSLPKEVISHINEYKNIKHKKISKLAWSILFNLLKNEFNAQLKDVKFSKNNKPYLKSKKIYFNISHSGNLIAIAINKKPVGVDIEQLIPRENCDLIAKRILNKTQLNKFNKSKNKQEFLTKVWSQKEAFIKSKDLSILNTKTLKNSKTDKIKSLKIIDKGNIYYLSYK